MPEDRAGILVDGDEGRFQLCMAYQSAAADACSAAATAAAAAAAVVVVVVLVVVVLLLLLLLLLLPLQFSPPLATVSNVWATTLHPFNVLHTCLRPPVSNEHRMLACLVLGGYVVSNGLAPVPTSTRQCRRARTSPVSSMLICRCQHSSLLISTHQC
jgi:hypothetical protein